MSTGNWNMLGAILIFTLCGLPLLWNVAAAYDYGGNGGRAGGSSYGRSYDGHNNHRENGNGYGGNVGRYGHGNGQQEYGEGYGGEHGGYNACQNGEHGQEYGNGHGGNYGHKHGGYGHGQGERYGQGYGGGYGPGGGGPMPPPSQQQAWPPMGPPSQAMPQVPWSPQQFPQPSGPWGPPMPPMGPPSSLYGQPCMPPYCPMPPGGPGEQPPGMPGGQPGTPGGPPGAGTTAAQTEPPSTTNANGGGPVTGNAASTTPTAADGTGTTVGAGTGTTAETTPATGTTTTAVTGTASSTTASQAALSLAQRAAALDGHNNFRSTLANGTAQNQTGTMPTGTNIIQLAYDTALETTAESWAQQCTFEHSTDSQRNGSGENLYWTSDRTIDFARVLQDACNFWWNELVQFGIQASLNLTLAEFNKGIGHWSQMAWSSTAKLGCGVNVCSNATYVVCHYSPAGNVINQLVYQSGTACRDCATAYGNGATCNTTNSLCIVP